MPKLRVLVVDDAVVIRKLVTEALERDPDIEVAGVAAHGGIALAKIPQVNPDAVILDVEMPEMDGIATVRKLRGIYPKLPVIMFSTLTERGAAATLEALSAGATDYVTKPANVGSVVEAIERLRGELVPKLKAHCPWLQPSSLGAGLATARVAPPRTRPATVTAPSIICIGTSTGGPNALADVFTELRQPLSVPVVVVQHMPPVFTRLLAERLSQSSKLSCVEGEDGQSLQPGKIYLAPGGKHMEVERNGPWGRLRLHEEPPVNSCRPSVDVLFASVAKAYGAAALGVVLTGMGQDGLRGCERLRENGGRVIVQDEATSIVWGMPARVAEAGLAEKILPLKEIADELRRRVDAVARATEKRSA